MMKKALLVIITFFIYSLSGVFSKLASMHEPLSFGYILCLGGVIAVLGIYAILWQKVLSEMQLNKAFLCKSISIVFSLAIANLMFKESISIYNIIGTAIIFTGLAVLFAKPSKS